MSLLKQTVDSLRTRGKRRTLEVILGRLGDHWFDWRYGTETVKEITLSRLRGLADDARSSLDYQPARVRFLQNLLRRLDWPKGSVFVDLGAGKGRTLLLAAQHGFRRVVGVDFSDELCEAARRNVDIFRTRVPVTSEVTIVKSDVIHYTIGDDENVFLLSPFGGTTLQRVLGNIEHSLTRAPRDIWLIYHNPVSPEIIDGRGTYTAIDSYVYGSSEAIIYTNQPAG